MIAKRIVYLLYYFKQMNWSVFQKFLSFASAKQRRNKASIFLSMINDSLKYNVSPLEYFQFNFFEAKNEEKAKWAGTGYMFEYQLRMNPKSHRKILENKILFLKSYNEFISRKFIDINLLTKTPQVANKILNNKSGKIVIKMSTGQVGAEVKVISSTKMTPSTLIDTLNSNRYDLVEEFVEQHDDLMKLSPSGLNTVRIFTQLHENYIDLLGARLRISINSQVDNMAAGNIAAPIDIDTGVIFGPGVYSDITKQDEYIHPITKVPIQGFRLPHWEATIEMVKKAAMKHPENKSIGWDIAITPLGPELIEGNHNWCKLLWQLPVKKGLKEMLDKYVEKQTP